MAAFLVVTATLGVILAVVQFAAVRLHFRVGRRPEAGDGLPPVSILKPLCGVDDDLEGNLESFAALEYPEFEVLLGVRDRSDRAWPVAEAAARRWPGRFRVVLQRGEPGLNPKVNQLLTLAAEARHDVLLVSDSNVRAPVGYLHDVAAHLSDPRVALVTHPVAGVGERTLGAALDNLQACAAVGPATVAAKVLAGRDVVVGKSMAFRRSDLRALGGFESVKDFLAEDYVLGVKVGSRLGRRVAIGSVALPTVNERRDVRAFLDRHGRWCVMQRKIAGVPLYAAQVLLQPLPFAIAALVARPGPDTLAFATLVWLARAMLDGATARTMRGRGFGVRVLWLSPAKDVLFLLAFLRAITVNHVEWRGTRLRVRRLSRLERIDARDRRQLPARPGRPSLAKGAP